MGNRLTRVGSLALALLLLASGATARALPGIAPAKDTAAAAAAAPATTAAAEPIAAADIPARGDADERFAQEVLDEARGADPTPAFEPRLSALSRSVSEQSALFKDKELKLLPVTRLESIERHWRFFQHQMAAWRDELKQATEQPLLDAADIGRRKAAWALTASAAQTDPLPEALARRIVEVQADLAAAEQALSPPIEKQIRLNSRANAIGSRIEAGQKAIAAAIAYNDRRLAHIDAPLLWSAQARGEGDTAGNSLRTGLVAEAQFVRDYSNASNLGSPVQTIAILAMLPLLLWLSRRSRKFTYPDPEVQASMRVLQRPISSWLLLTTTSVLIVEPDAPIILHQFALFLALVPVLRLLPPGIRVVLGPWPYVATGLYLLHLTGFLFLGNAYYHRVYLLALTLLSMVLMLWQLWHTRGRSADASSASLARRLVRDAAWSGVAVLALSALANAVGNVSLAEMLTGALLLTGYLGLVLYAGVNVLASILRLLLTRGRISQLPLVAQYARPLLRGLTWAMRVAAALGWLALALNQFRIFRPLHQAATAILTHPFAFGQISLTLGNVATFVLSVLLAFWVARTTRGLLHEDILPNLSLPRGVANSVSSLSYYALLLLGLLVALAAAGFEVSKLTLVIGALGVGIGLGLQGVVNNFVSGLILMFERPIQPGDIVEVTGTSGTVREIGMRATTLSTFDGADVVVPNGTLLSEKLINWTLSSRNRRMEVNLGVAYGNDPEAVLALLLKVTQACSGVAADPEPGVFFNGFGTSSLDFSVRAWTNQHSEWVQTRSDLSVSIYKALVEAGIEIAFPQMDLHLRSMAPEVREMLGEKR